VTGPTRPRVVSLVPSVSETLVAWGVTPVAVTRFCEQPGLATVGGTKNPDVAAIVGLAPDLVVVNDEENRREDADALAAAGLALHVVVIRGVDDVGPELDRLAGAVGVAPPGWRAPPRPDRLDRLDRPDRPDRPDGAPRRRAFVPIWRRPWMTLSGATYGSSLLEAVGVENVFADAVDRYPEVTLEEAAARRPDVVLAPSEPYAFRPAHLEELRQVAPVVEVDGQDLFWWGARTPAAIDRLAGAVR